MIGIVWGLRPEFDRNPLLGQYKVKADFDGCIDADELLPAGSSRGEIVYFSKAYSHMRQIPELAYYDRWQK